MGLSKKKDKNQKRGPARDRTGIVGIRIQSDNHYTTEPLALITPAPYLIHKFKDSLRPPYSDI